MILLDVAAAPFILIPAVIAVVVVGIITVIVLLIVQLLRNKNKDNTK